MEAYYYRVCVCANKFFPLFFSKFKILLHKSDKRLPNCFNRIDIACLWWLPIFLVNPSHVWVGSSSRDSSNSSNFLDASEWSPFPKLKFPVLFLCYDFSHILSAAISIASTVDFLTWNVKSKQRTMLLARRIVWNVARNWKLLKTVKNERTLFSITNENWFEFDQKLWS